MSIIFPIRGLSNKKKKEKSESKLQTQISLLQDPPVQPPPAHSVREAWATGLLVYRWATMVLRLLISFTWQERDSISSVHRTHHIKYVPYTARILSSPFALATLIIATLNLILSAKTYMVPGVFVLACWARDEMEKFWQTNLLTFCRFRSVFTFAQVHYSLSQTQFLLQRKYQHSVLQSHLWAFTSPLFFL